MKFLEKATKNLNFWDLGLVKWSVFAFALWLIALIPAFAAWVVSVSPWVFLVLWIVLAARPFYKAYLKK